ncbi:EAL domain-containing protein [Thiomicrospira sp. ALE5]|uniref:EAL domain-containing protein n=1 Tax=Thiomicrospira sp. ALE5 TaxID=748650 RepID=UPI0008EF5540|nr:EAL domain-containing protein [Thiomicrospira sp. ALE5]SFR56019.1 PAS domain S-box-containing protein/diguanylate cyclase (GGDEF) domain-containing protein [Thiomicrospira sp. ALE5]
MFRTRSLRQKLILIIMGCVASSFILGYLIFIAWFQVNQQRDAQQQAEAIAQLLSQEFAQLILVDRLEVAADINNKLSSFKQLDHSVLFNNEGLAINQYHANQVARETLIDLAELTNSLNQRDGLKRFIMPISYQGLELGQAFMAFQSQTIWSRIAQDLHFIIFTIFLALSFSFFMALWLEKRFSGPVIKLVRFLAKIISGKQLDQRIHTTEINEFKTLYDEVNTMLARIQQDHTELQLAAVAFETPNAIMITDTQHKILRVNHAFCELTGYGAEEVIGKAPNIFHSDKHDPDFYDQVEQQLAQQHHWQGEMWNRRKNGELFLEALTIQPAYDDQNQLTHFVAVFNDITQQHEAKEQIKALVSFDQVTGLANRNQLVENLDKLLDDQQHTLALLCFDIDDFKKVNDVFGHATGDQLLVELANRLRAAFYDATLLARMGGDEFAIVLQLPALHEQQLIFQLEQEAEQILAFIAKPFQISDQTLHPKGSVGISYHLTKQSTTAELMIQQADAALHQAKTTEDQSIIFFDPQAEQQALASIELYNQIKIALKSKCFELHLQPQYHQSLGLVGAEALIRWRDPYRGLIPPYEFIPIAENSDLILPLGHWVVKTACEQLAKWQTNPLTAHLTLAVNVSSKQFYAKNFVTEVAETIKAYGLDARKLKLELTETLVAHDLDKMIDIMTQLSRLGVRLSLDDFGTGYSSLRYLQKLPFSQIKIDQSFVANLLDPHCGDEAIVSTIISLGKAYDFDIIAEGVETQAQKERLAELGCVCYQGYFFGRPVPITEFEQLLLS